MVDKHDYHGIDQDFNRTASDDNIIKKFGYAYVNKEEENLLTKILGVPKGGLQFTMTEAKKVQSRLSKQIFGGKVKETPNAMFLNHLYGYAATIAYVLQRTRALNQLVSEIENLGDYTNKDYLDRQILAQDGRPWKAFDDGLDQSQSKGLSLGSRYYIADGNNRKTKDADDLRVEELLLLQFELINIMAALAQGLFIDAVNDKKYITVEATSYPTTAQLNPKQTYVLKTLEIDGDFKKIESGAVAVHMIDGSTRDFKEILQEVEKEVPNAKRLIQAYKTSGAQVALERAYVGLQRRYTAIRPVSYAGRSHSVLDWTQNQTRMPNRLEAGMCPAGATPRYVDHNGKFIKTRDAVHDGVVAGNVDVNRSYCHYPIRHNQYGSFVRGIGRNMTDRSVAEQRPVNFDARAMTLDERREAYRAMSLADREAFAAYVRRIRGKRVRRSASRTNGSSVKRKRSSTSSGAKRKTPLKRKSTKRKKPVKRKSTKKKKPAKRKSTTNKKPVKRKGTKKNKPVKRKSTKEKKPVKRKSAAAKRRR